MRKKAGFRTAYLLGTFLEGLYLWFSMEKEPKMTRFLAEQLAKSHWFTIQKARRDLGYEPRVSTSEGLDRVAAWLADRQK